MNEKQPNKLPQDGSALLEQGNDLLQQSLSAFNLAPVQPVAMVFPDVIGGRPGGLPDDMTANVNEIFKQQAHLFEQPPVMVQPAEAPVSDQAQEADIAADILSMYK